MYIMLNSCNERVHIINTTRTLTCFTLGMFSLPPFSLEVPETVMLKEIYMYTTRRDTTCSCKLIHMLLINSYCYTANNVVKTAGSRGIHCMHVVTE